MNPFILLFILILILIIAIGNIHMAFIAKEDKLIWFDILSTIISIAIVAVDIGGIIALISVMSTMLPDIPIGV